MGGPQGPVGELQVVRLRLSVLTGPALLPAVLPGPVTTDATACALISNSTGSTICRCEPEPESCMERSLKRTWAEAGAGPQVQKRLVESRAGAQLDSYCWVP